MNSLRIRTAIILFLLLACFVLLTPKDGSGPETAEQCDAQPVQTVGCAFYLRQSDIQVAGSGEVLRILADDTEGSRHQRFILRMADGQTLLIAHNIDLAPRLENLAKGDWVAFFGEYEWNAKGGVIHWTHHDPAAKHPDGWLQYKDRLYQ